MLLLLIESISVGIACFLIWKFGLFPKLAKTGGDLLSSLAHLVGRHELCLQKYLFLLLPS